MMKQITLSDNVFDRVYVEVTWPDAQCYMGDSLCTDAIKYDPIEDVWFVPITLYLEHHKIEIKDISAGHSE